MIKTLKDLNQAGRRFWAGANAKTKDAVPPGMEKCPNCGGFGRKYGEPCDVCHGKGFIPEGSADATGGVKDAPKDYPKGNLSGLSHKQLAEALSGTPGWMGISPEEIMSKYSAEKIKAMILNNRGLRDL